MSLYFLSPFDGIRYNLGYAQVFGVQILGVTVLSQHCVCVVNTFLFLIYISMHNNWPLYKSYLFYTWSILICLPLLFNDFFHMLYGVCYSSIFIA